MRTSILILVIISLASCTKNVTRVCEINMSSIAGNYKLTKFELVSYNTGVAQDVTSTLTNCESSGVYKFNVDNTISYTEMNNCNGNGNGIWNLTDGNLTTSFESGNGSRISNASIQNWDCKDLVLITSFPSVENNNRYTLTKQ